MKNKSFILMFIISFSGLASLACVEASDVERSRIVIESEGWKLVGDLQLPPSDKKLPAVLLLNQAAGTRAPYEELADQLAARGIASLRIDLRAHGESTNLGEFIPPYAENRKYILDTDVDIATTFEYLKSHERIDAEKIGIVGASYSGEEMAEAARKSGYANHYVALSPGSFSDESIQAIDVSGIPWLFIYAKDDQFLQTIGAKVREDSRTVEMLIIPGDTHATNILKERPDMSERIATWLAQRLLD